MAAGSMVWEDSVLSSPLLSPPALRFCWSGQNLRARVSGRKGQRGGHCSVLLEQSLGKSKAPLGRSCLWTPGFGPSYPASSCYETPAGIQGVQDSAWDCRVMVAEPSSLLNTGDLTHTPGKETSHAGEPK